MNRRGMSILSDLIWLLTFIIVAVLCYAFLYKPITERYTDQITSVQSEALAGNAQYMAAALLSQQAVSGTNQGSPGTFADSIIQLMDAYDTAVSASPGMLPGLDGASAVYVAGPALESFPETVAGSSYKATLDAAFGPDAEFWKQNPDISPSISSVVVAVYTDDDTAISPTCIQYNRPGYNANDVCKHSTWAAVDKWAKKVAAWWNTDDMSDFFSGKSTSTQEVEFVENHFPKRFQPWGRLQTGAESPEHGVVHLPTAQGSISFAVTVVWLQ